MRCAAAFLLMAFVIPAISGCGSVTGSNPYPASLWGALDPGRTPDGCPNLSGAYGNVAAARYPDEAGEAPRLNDVFARMALAGDPLRPGEGGRDWNVPRDADFVTIAQNAEELTLSFIEARGTRHVLHFRRQHFDLSEKRFDDLFTCYSGEDAARLRFFPELDREVIASPVYMGGGATLVFLLRGADGSLVVQLRTESVGLSQLLVGSHVDFSSVWYRYPPVDVRIAPSRMSSP
jgi:hypothetical protein